MPVEFLLAARQDYDQSFDWYFERSAQAAQKFADAVKDALARISTDPNHWALMDAIHRECRVKRFPFRIVFRIDGERIVVVAIAHAKRRPSYWRGRS